MGVEGNAVRGGWTLIGVVAISLGVGNLCGTAWGGITFGAAILGCLVFCDCCRALRRMW